MKVLHIVNGLWPGGAQMMLLRLTETMQKDGVDNAIVSLTQSNTIASQFKQLGVDVVFCSSKFSIPVQINKAIKSFKPDVIQCWMYHSNLACQVSKLVFRHTVPVCWSIHHCIDDISDEKMTTRMVVSVLSRMSSAASAIVYVARISRVQHEKLGFNPYKSVTIPNGYNLELFRKDDEERNSLRMELGVDDSVFLVGSLGRFHPVKDHKTFLSAAKHAVSLDPNMKFLLAGRDVTQQNETLMSWLSEMNMTDKVFVLGDRRDVPRLLNGLDLLSTSSTSEAFSVIVGEAMATETPCVVTDVGDSAWLVGDKEFAVPHSNPELLGRKWAEISLMTNTDRELLGKQMRDRIEQKFSLDIVFNKYKELYVNLTA